MNIRSGCLLVIASIASAAGASLHFTRDGQKVLVPFQQKLDWSGEMTLEAWVYPEPASSTRYYNYVISRNYDGKGYGLCIQGGAKKTPNIGRADIPIGKWTHIAVCMGAHAMKLYVNGALAFAQPGDGRPRTTPLPLYIGNSNFVGGPPDQPTGFFGKIAEVQIWNVALDQEQIKSKMHRFARSGQKHLLAYFPLIEGRGTIAHDFTGHLMSGHLGDDFSADANDPNWSADEPPITGRRPRIREHKV